MGTKVVINQPYYFPSLHWWNRTVNCDVLVYLDDVHHNTNFPVNRAKVFDGKKEQYLTIPLPKKHRRDKINEIEVEYGWSDDHENKMWSYYCVETHALMFGCGAHKNLADAVITSIEDVNNLYELGLPERIRSSSLNLTSTKNDRLIDICKAVGGDTLILGMGSKNYIESEIDKYKYNNIEIQYQDWKCPVKNYSILHTIVEHSTNNTYKIKDIIK